MGSGNNADRTKNGDGRRGADDSPEWAAGLKQLYDSVVDEPLPDSFRDLLARLDDEDPQDAASSPGGDPA